MIRRKLNYFKKINNEITVFNLYYINLKNKILIIISWFFFTSIDTFLSVNWYLKLLIIYLRMVHLPN